MIYARVWFTYIIATRIRHVDGAFGMEAAISRDYYLSGVLMTGTPASLRPGRRGTGVFCPGCPSLGKDEISLIINNTLDKRNPPQEDLRHKTRTV